MESLFLNIAFISYIIATLSYGLFLFIKNKKFYYIALPGIVIGALANVTSLTIRGIVANRVPFSNMYESIVLLAFALAVTYIILEFIFKIRKLGFFISAFLILIIAYASFFLSDQISPLVPALQSNWLTIHVLSYFVGYGALCISFVTAIIGLIKPQEELTTNDITYKIVSFSFPFLTIGLITGAVWAKQAWGNYWGWDPKETWSLITWFIYLNYLHLPFTLPKALKKIGVKATHESKILNIISIIGFLALLFTYFGVNYVLSGLHSYTN